MNERFWVKHGWTAITSALLLLHMCLGQKDCTGVDCPHLDSCIEEVLEDGTCCATCSQRGCTCKGYQYYDCISAGFKNGKVPEGESYLVDSGSTECWCPAGGGDISCRFIPCPDIPPHCIELSDSTEVCPHCLRLGCVHHDHKYEAGHSFHIDPCQVCHCPNDGGDLMCSVIPDCSSETTKNPEVKKKELHVSKHEHPEDYLSEDHKFQSNSVPIYTENTSEFEEGKDYNYFPEATAGPYAFIPSSASLQTQNPHEVLHEDTREELRETLGTYDVESQEEETKDLLNVPNTETASRSSEKLSSQMETVARHTQVPPGESTTITTDDIRRTEWNLDDHRNLHHTIPELSTVPKLQFISTTGPPVNMRESEAHRQPQTLGRYHQAGNGLHLTFNNQNGFLSRHILTCSRMLRHSPTRRGCSDLLQHLEFIGMCDISSAVFLLHGFTLTLMCSAPQKPGAAPLKSSQSTSPSCWTSAALRVSRGRRTAQTVDVPNQRRFPSIPGRLACAVKLERIGPLLTATATTWYPRGQTRVLLAGNSYSVNLVFVTAVFTVVMDIHIKVLWAQRQCCLRSLRETQCSSGINTARRGRDCGADGTDLCDSYMQGIVGNVVVCVQECCTCCALGLRLRAQRDSCDPPQGLGATCSHALLTCCERTGSTNQSTVRERTSPRATSPPRRVSEGPEHQAFSLEEVEDTENMVEKVEGLEDVDECSVYAGQLCHHQCVNTRGSYVCVCFPGFVLQPDGIQCLQQGMSAAQEDAGWCTFSFNDKCPSAGNGHCAHYCHLVEGRAHCSCSPGFTLMSDGHSCEDVDECFHSTHSCQLTERCENTVGSFRCLQQIVCPSGYQLRNDFCEDINECTLGAESCGLGFDCINTAGSFSCRATPRCPGGFTQDSRGQCTDIDECRTVTQPCSPGFNCINTVGSYTCQRKIILCGRGYHSSPDGTRCIDTDECETGVQRCGEGQICHNLPGTYRCDCHPGYQYDMYRRMCVDVNECWRYSGRLCAQTCENTPGSYRCSCNSGFTLSSDGKSCEDVNECLNSPCSHECVNVYGSYQCYCRQGYYLREDAHTCEDIDECSQSIGHLCAYKCVNVPGSYDCACPEHGYSMAPNRRSCHDIDECTVRAHNCTADETCYNIHGGFRCLSFSCPTNYRRATDTRCERISCSNFLECQNSPVRITYYQLSFQTNIIIPALIFRMGPSPAYSGDNVIISISSGNEEGYFSPRKLNAYTGAIYLQRQLPQPRDFLLDVEMKLWRQGTFTTFLARIYIFITANVV
ncbi:hypothetical protein QTP70_029362 [Hemibagrus guttatus]|uniref:Fibulin 2 n=1 Tax=Hemibagrus guttatus TaxID=175788 RepID=A0AAE0QGB9_9TELE|nr:hypothetical protein QTP70_029362 [Hemibagrus guttatus]